jgi:hypothetical protein
MPQPPIIIVALKQPTSRAPPSSTKAAMVRSAIRPFRDVPHVTQRSQNSLAVAPQLVTGTTLVCSAQSFRSLIRLPTDR